jgi:hypothetical protein
MMLSGLTIVHDIFSQVVAKEKYLNMLSNWNENVRVVQLSIAAEVRARAVNTEQRQRLERYSRSKQRNFLLKEEKLRKKIEDGVVPLDILIAEGHADAAECESSLDEFKEDVIGELKKAIFNAMIDVANNDRLKKLKIHCLTNKALNNGF